MNTESAKSLCEKQGCILACAFAQSNQLPRKYGLRISRPYHFNSWMIKLIWFVWPDPGVIDTLFMLNTTEQEIYPAHYC